MKTLTPTRFQYNLSLLNGGSTTVRVEQKVNGVYQYLATQQTQTSSGTYELSFVPSETDIRISVSGTSRYALQNLYLDRDQIDTLVSMYALSPSSYGEHHLLPVFTSFACSGYRYGFQGQEKDDEAKGRGNSYTTEFRQYDPRLGRWLSLDPLMASFPWQSPYVAFDNNPIYYNDPMGMASEVASTPPPGEKSANNDDKAWNKYTKREQGNDVVKILAPNGGYFEFNKDKLSFNYSDGKESEKQIKKEGVWSVTNAEGQFLWDNIAEKYIKNTSGVGPGKNGPPTMSNTSTYAGGNNPKGYSQPPQNIADAAGRRHDLDYDNLGLAGGGGVASPKSMEANTKLVLSCDIIISMHKKGEIDPITGARVSDLTLEQALLMKRAFTATEILKSPVTIPETIKMVGREFQQGFNGMYNSLINFWLQY